MKGEAEEPASALQPGIRVFRPDRPGIRKVLGDLEAEIMELVWAQPTAEGTTVRAVFEVLHAQRRIAYTTVMNTMARLARKSILRVEKADQAYVYRPSVTREDFISRFVSRILEDLLVSFTGATLRGLNALADREAATRAQQLGEDVARRRQAAEGQ